MKVYLDLDGVIANFTKSITRVLNIEYPKQKEINIWGELFHSIPNKDFDKAMAGHSFWEEIEPFPYAVSLVAKIDDESRGNWEFLTKPAQDAGCYSGKFAWVKKHFPEHLSKLNLVNGSKSKCARQGHILVDDSTRNIEEWRREGGTGIRWVERTDDFDKDYYLNKLYLLQRAVSRNDNVEI